MKCEKSGEVNCEAANGIVLMQSQDANLEERVYQERVALAEVQVP